MGSRQRPPKDEREKRLPPFSPKHGDGALVSGNPGPKFYGPLWRENLTTS